MKQKTKKCYIGELNCNPDAGVIAVVADNYNDGRAFVRISELTEGCDCGKSFVCVRVKVNEEINVDDQPLGELDDEEALKRGAYAHLNGWDCKYCGRPSTQVYWIEKLEKIMCGKCDYELSNKNQP